jgi:hypothetical protein
VLSPWRYAWSSVAGTSHLRRGLPCQDHAEVTTWPVSDPDPALVLAVADGAGSAERADEGARRACLAFLEYAGRAVAWMGPAHLPDDHGQRSLEIVQDEIAELARETGTALSAFACTLLAGVVGAHSALFLQLGDGAIAVRSVENPSWRLAAIPQRGEFANQTVFVTRRDAARHLQAVHLQETVLEVALMSDGVEFIAVKQATATPHAPFLEHVLHGLRCTNEAGHAAAHDAWLTAFLDSPSVNARTDDDKTLVLATRVLSG